MSLYLNYQCGKLTCYTTNYTFTYAFYIMGNVRIHILTLFTIPLGDLNFVIKIMMHG